MLVVDARALRKTYTTPRGTIAAVDGLDVHAQKGEFVAICGRSGSGKSTLLGMLGGLCRPTEGTVRVDGVDLGSLGPGELADLRARRFGFMFQFAGLVPNLRAVDNIALPALLCGVDEASARDRARDLLSQVGLGARWDAHPGDLSGGQQRRVALARALVNRPVLLLGDEPTNDLDEQAEREAIGLLRALQKAHLATLIVVTHDPALARRADRVIQVQSGKVVSSARREAAFERARPEVTVAAFEPEPPALTPAEPTPLGEGLWRFLVGFVGWTLVVACGLYAVNHAAASLQRRSVEAKITKQKQAERLALQQLRADVDDLISQEDGSHALGVYLQNESPDRPLYVLGPSLTVFVQIDRTWQPVPIVGEDGPPGGVHRITGKQSFPIRFRADFDRYDELIRGYMHVRIHNVMVVGERPDGAGDLFPRTDDYYIYLKPPKLPEDEVRRRNGWKEGAVVPRWIAMPPH
jgi:putative ABC transport system ATP-binding protein/macrolide transport system ATP-binding/permease protein/lipoprotein-releasing system ATP-binding protein